MQKLKQILRPQATDTQSSAPPTQPPGNSTPAPRKQYHNLEANSSDSGGSAQAVSSRPSSAAGSTGNTPNTVGPEEKMAAWFSAVTPEDLNYFRNMPPKELAGGQDCR